MKLFLVILILCLLPGPIFCEVTEIDENIEKEYYPLSEEEIINITEGLQKLEKENKIQKLLIGKYELQIRNYKELSRHDSLEISLKDMKIQHLEEIVELQKPTFGESLTDNKYFGFVMGVTVTIGAAGIIYHTSPANN